MDIMSPEKKLLLELACLQFDTFCNLKSYLSAWFLSHYQMRELVALFTQDVDVS